MTAMTQMTAFEEDKSTRDCGASVRLNAEQIVVANDNSSRLVFATDPTGLSVECYKLLRSRIRAMSPSGGMLLVTSPGPGEGKTLTSTNLAWSLAEAGRDTCLVDLDFRAPSLANSLGYYVPADDPGAAEVLTGESTLTAAVRRIKDRSLYLLGIRDARQSPAELLATATLRPLLTKLRETFEWVILDMPPALPMADVPEVLQHVDGALMVVRAGKTSRALVVPTIELLGSKLWGAVLNDSAIHGSGYYGYYGYGEERRRKK